MKKRKMPYYGKKTKKQVVESYLHSATSMDELAEIYGILGSNTVANWLRKYGKFKPKKFLNTDTMRKKYSSEEEKNQRFKKYKTQEHLRICELESDLDIARQKLRFYSLSLSLINELALELTGIDLVKKTGELLSKKSIKQKS